MIWWWFGLMFVLAFWDSILLWSSDWLTLPVSPQTHGSPVLFRSTGVCRMPKDEQSLYTTCAKRSESIFRHVNTRTSLSFFFRKSHPSAPLSEITWVHNWGFILDRVVCLHVSATLCRSGILKSTLKSNSDLRVDIFKILVFQYKS